ncbi:2OG-Fe(II) oxygenase [Synechococcus phage S-H9-1]|uniref:2OG-Fe(II) oxygenase n=1 Tax=Synechococcus phage S-H9-1 TaxID=2783674 RepID=A0A873WFE6_9CAUD|nr:2OG-Fe(II) oxygenase [Synechococcus phage S-H9-1]QPB08076.1 2OG-Fe(II) oxygenase [Synechococcus phage S-H9-1]
MYQLIEYIQIYSNVLTSDDLDLIMSESKESSEWQEARIASSNGGVEDDGQRKSGLLKVTSDYKFYQLLHDKNEYVAEKYCDKFPACRLWMSYGHEILRYDTGGFFKIHTDHYAGQPRTMSMIYLLNDNYGGGEISFFQGDYSIKPQAGSCVVFPSNFMYPHEIKEVTSGTRYSIVSWSV